MENKCPLCGNRMQFGQCVSCGFEIPDESSIASVYNHEPEDNNSEDGDSWDEMPSIGVPLEGDIQQKLQKQTPKPSDAYKNAAVYGSAPKNNAAPANKTAPTSSAAPYVYTEQETEQEIEQQTDSIFNIFVHGFVEEVKRHWWKVLLIGLFPVSAVAIGSFYMMKSNGFRRYRYMNYDPENFDFKAFLTGILYLVIGIGLISSGWDPFGLTRLIFSLI